ncbi:transporter substrate-binding domain-containing protein [Clostridium bovifaecis]|uniref:Transporter substrate-binding domain-containing protein n=1 Tax=Clostridium bovifaecis TaxID=2184719 RepID=A0A6I6EV25_9CLOT|nr:transporter substrate-binding domain-containing protein [Clostridium bovifaecis]
MKLFKKLIIGAVILSSLVVFTACGNKPAETTEGKKTVKIAYLPLTHAVPLYVEHEDEMINKEELKNVNIELVKYGSWPELMDALNTGKVDGASVLVQLAMKAKSQGIGLKAVALGHRDGTNITVAKDINNVSDLKGKTIAIPQRFSTMNILLYQMLEDAGMSYSDVKVVELAPPEMPAALSEGRISAYIVAEPFGATSVINGKGKTILQSKDLWENSICCAFVLRDEFIKNNAEAAQELVNGYVEAGKKSETKDDSVQQISSKYMSVNKDVLDLSLKSTVYTDLKINEKDYEKLTSYLTTMKLLDNPPKYSDFVDSSLINKAE